MCACVHIPQCTCGGQEHNIGESISLLLPCGNHRLHSGHRGGTKYLYLLSHLVNPRYVVLFWHRRHHSLGTILNSLSHLMLFIFFPSCSVIFILIPRSVRISYCMDLPLFIFSAVPLFSNSVSLPVFPLFGFLVWGDNR